MYSTLHPYTKLQNLNVQCTPLTQGALEALQSLTELTPSAVILKCRASLLLADANNMSEGPTHPEMVQVFRGLHGQLKEQASVLPTCYLANHYMALCTCSSTQR